MTQWLAAGHAPGSFSIDRDCELQAAAEERPAVRYVRHNLDSDEVRNHIAGGKTATRLALTWNDRVSFVLTEQLQVKSWPSSISSRKTPSASRRMPTTCSPRTSR